MIYRVRQLISSIYRSLYFPPAIIALAILTATGVTWHAAKTSLANDTQEAINSHIDDTERSIRDTLNSYEEILQGGVGLYRGSDNVTNEDWKHFLQAFNIQKDFPSAQTIGFIQVVPAADVASFTAAMRTQPGFENYQIQPLDPGVTDYAPLVYAQAIATHSPLRYGYDTYSDPTRKQAMLQARDTGETTMTERLTLQPLNGGSYAGFVVFVPYYGHQDPPATLAARRAAIAGYVYASFRADLFFTHNTDTGATRNAGYQVRVGNDQIALYQSPQYTRIHKEHGAQRVTRALVLYGQAWSIDYTFRSSTLLSVVQLRRPTAILISGTFTAFLIAFVVLLLLKARSHELTMQKEQAVELAKDELLSLASHQLRTPATGVKQYLGMILQGFAGEVPKSQRSLLDKAYASNDRQLHIINEILHLAKIESGRIVLARQETDLNNLLQDILAEQQSDIAAAKHIMHVKLPKRPFVLNVDGHTLRMAIENIISNAVKYTPKGGEITITMHKTHAHIFIRVKDTGVGVSPNDTDKLFKQFTRLPNEMSLSVGGTGIGLYLAKHLVELHGGSISVKSVPGKGSTFTIVLPVDS